MTPEKLAPELGITAKHLRAWLRKTYPRTPEQKFARWTLSPAHVAAARARFGGGPVRATSREMMRVTSVALDVSVHDRLVRTAEMMHSTLTELVRRAVTEWLERHSAGPDRTRGQR